MLFDKDIDILLDEVTQQFGPPAEGSRLAEVQAARRERRALLEQRLAAVAADSDAAKELQEQDDLDNRSAKARLYLELAQLNRTALCLSGGGIRSAAFNLGIIQALASASRTPARATTAADSLLAKMDYVSTVSGGGYIGSWLTSWMHRPNMNGLPVGFAEIWKRLVGRLYADLEPKPLSNLRRYSNYLTPKLGLFSADSWSAGALYGRNLFLNWLILIPALCIPLLMLKGFAVLAAWFWRVPDAAVFLSSAPSILIYLAPLLASIALILALAWVTENRPTYAVRAFNQTQFLIRILLPVVIADIFYAGFFLSPVFTDWAARLRVWESDALGLPDPLHKWVMALVGALIGAAIYGLAWLKARFIAHAVNLAESPLKDFIAFLFGGAVYGAIIGFGAYLLLLLPNLAIHAPAVDCGVALDLGQGVSLKVDPAAICPGAASAGVPAVDADAAPFYRLYAVLALGLPWLVMAQLTGEAVFTGLTSFLKDSDGDREWLGRAAGWYMMTSVVWFSIALLIYLGSGLLVDPAQLQMLKDQAWIRSAAEHVSSWGAYLAPIGGISGIATALLGSSSWTGKGGKAKAQESPIRAALAEKALTLASFLFILCLIVFLSALLDRLMFGHSIFGSELLLPKIAHADEALSDLRYLFVVLAVLIAVLWLASRAINVNRFSLHAVYRNRLIREFLGASHRDRQPNRFTDFDITDNRPMHELLPLPTDPDHPTRRRLLHVVNMTLNIVSTRNLAWQERKGESFTVSPLHSGSACVGYRPSQEYASSDGAGITLGTAMAISGAAASPNMGYHTSPGVAFLMTLFNVRLGWWLGNPARGHYRKEGPQFALKWFLFEAFGLTTDEKDFVYLSDGGHFENLGLYEMVRRRCRRIIVCDAGADPDCAFEDLGNAVRKIELDLGIKITFAGLDKLRKRLPTEEAQTGARLDAPYHCLGTIGYGAANTGAEDGAILYIKPGFHGTESAGIRAYALAHDDFPHESTADQWFSESQFESYRKLGFEILDGILQGRGSSPALADFFAAP